MSGYRNNENNSGKVLRIEFSTRLLKSLYLRSKGKIGLILNLFSNCYSS